MHSSNFRTLLMASCASAVVAMATTARAQSEEVVAFNIPAQPLSSALTQFAKQSKAELLFQSGLARDRQAPAVQGEMSASEGLSLLLAQSGLQYRQAATGSFVIEAAQDPQSGSAAGDGAEVEALIVTAQKREEDIQDVPIAISAFTQEQLDRSQVAGGPDLMTQVPNMTFTKTNFSTYSIQLRGIGTQAISATVDHAVAVAFNNTPFIRNRFFEQEFYDLQRVEVLRGPQGTLYGRNATAGVVNLISQKPKFSYDARVSGDIANYNSSRIEGMINVPLVDDKVALRLAGAWTKREGYSTNQLTGNPIDGRDLWSTRASLRFEPTDALVVDLIWEHFEEDDDRIRSGKQLCKTHEVTSLTAIHPGPDGRTLNGLVEVFPITHFQTLPELGQPLLGMGAQATFSQGCEPSSLYSPDSFQTPNGLSLPYYVPLSSVGLPIALSDPYVSRTQSHDLRVIESTVDPHYQAETDVVELQINYDLTDSLTITSETGYSTDFIFSTQDYNRFNTASGAWGTTGTGAQFVSRGILTPEGVFCDPQIGCADRMVAVDISTAKSRHFSQELRIGSSFDGPFNFSLGANFLRYDTEDKYYVFINSLSLYSANETSIQQPYVGGVTDNIECMPHGFVLPEPDGSAVLSGCMYIDPNPIGQLNDLGHNYFLSRNPYKLISYAVFGESYYQITDALKLTAGLRWTVDKKEAPRIPSWVLAAGTVGLSVAEVVEQEWSEPTGRLALDWKPELGFTDETLLYASYAHGYKAGGMNPPAAGIVCYGGCGNFIEGWMNRSAAKPKQFDAEYIDAYELGSKNTMFDGTLTLNLAAFYYNYQDYQLSQIIDRSAVTQGFDAKIWGLEIEADWRPLENLRLGFKGGYENTRVADGERAIDVMDRTAGMPGWSVISPFPTFPSNCILPTFLYAGNAGFFNGAGGDINQRIPVNLGNPGGGFAGGCELAYLFRVDPVTQLPYVANPTAALGMTALFTRPGYPGWDPLDASQGHNFGEGFYKDLSGNELPNAPDYTATITADYTIPMPNDWLATLHTDLYYQSEAWTRIFNMEGYDKLKAYTNVNFAAIFTQEELGWKVMAYVKNVFDRDSITGAFINSDDTGLTTNVFLTDPRLYGLRVTKEFTGGPWWTGANPNHTGPYPLTLELGGQVQRLDADYGPIRPTVEGMPAAFDPAEPQDRDFDWGDGREVRLIYRPGSSSWKIAAGYRFGSANTGLHRGHFESFGAQKFCAFPINSAQGQRYCNPEFSAFGLPPGFFYNPIAVQGAQYLGDSEASTREEHEIIEFSVGRDVGLGLLGIKNSSLSLGLRNAQIHSETDFGLHGDLDTSIGDGWFFTGTELNRYRASATSTREFDGVGPVLTWEAALPLLGDDDSGHLDVDWSVTGGVLFGKQDSETIGTITTLGYMATYYSQTALTPVIESIGAEPRSTDVEIPVLDLSVGLSYAISRVKVGAGYRWEKYFDVLDVGYQEAQEADRVMDGPYFKLSVGFGG